MASMKSSPFFFFFQEVQSFLFTKEISFVQSIEKLRKFGSSRKTNEGYLEQPYIIVYIDICHISFSFLIHVLHMLNLSKLR